MEYNNNENNNDKPYKNRTARNDVSMKWIWVHGLTDSLSLIPYGVRQCMRGYVSIYVCVCVYMNCLCECMRISFFGWTAALVATVQHRHHIYTTITSPLREAPDSFAGLLIRLKMSRMYALDRIGYPCQNVRRSLKQWRFDIEIAFDIRVKCIFHVFLCIANDFDLEVGLFRSDLQSNENVLLLKQMIWHGFWCCYADASDMGSLIRQCSVWYPACMITNH